MWTAKPRPNPADPNWEPVELIVLKQKLAKLSKCICKCLADRPDCTTSPLCVHPNDKDVQVEERKKGSFDRFTQASQASIQKDREEVINSLTKDVLCPSCFVTMSLLRGRALKILKDEESETINDMFRCNKATEKKVMVVERTTSFTVRPNVMFLEDLSDSDGSLDRGMRRPHQVKFGNVTTNSRQQMTSLHAPPCYCLEKFMDSIRPPILESYAY